MIAEPPAVLPHISQEMLNKGLALVRSRAAALWHPNAANVTFEDLVSIGQVVLYERAPAFDKARRARFTTYLFPYIDGAMRSALREEKKESRIERAITREAQRWSSTLTDQFDIFYNTREETRGSFHKKAQQLASCLVVTVAVEASRRQGSEHDTAELHDHAVACSTMHQKIAAMEPEQQELWREHYVEDKTLVQIAKETGVSENTMRRRKERFDDEVFEALYERGIKEMPRVR
jgi:RNA polymerase sigma factor (sigma-70 family)